MVVYLSILVISVISNIFFFTMSDLITSTYFLYYELAGILVEIINDYTIHLKTIKVESILSITDIQQSELDNFSTLLSINDKFNLSELKNTHWLLSKHYRLNYFFIDPLTFKNLDFYKSTTGYL